ncbi:MULTISPECIES: helix-turn-helix domain-containing protein [Rhodococcus]|uniref:helix-turn-helix transcriptional regulator n=1 Tax=Rhodococcus TaxID=1827 RepID=UPI00163A5F5C|nr:MULTISPECIES: helix-turn-helix domain-containing protein [Rhodococcus]MBC2587041.1 helix-turn-helix domain-containing protein [Rhodococcus aetherivorans]QRI74854.1 helix-turn-helix domain-containing protein [Rhodococcus aetherivorans]QSE58264.1 helix-turn-helix domain-containing protein [Rhodococcus sp. PSBB066]QSE70414.1 helix-turn-helix domain-containing protein [Rhodococcus sp. PSBB049]
MPANKPPRRLASIPQAAEELGVCTKTLRRYISAGHITGYRLGPRMIRVDLNEIEATLRPMAAGGAA